jgi:hypothetical protein
VFDLSRLHEREGSPTIFGLATLHAPFERLLLGLPFAYPVSDFDAALAAAWLQDGALAADPKAMRARLDRLGGGHGVHAEDGWLWIELEALAAHRDEAASTLAAWIDVEALAADRRDRLRRETRLAALAETADATRAAEIAFERLAGKAAWNPEELPTPEALEDWLRATLQPDAAVLVHVVDPTDRSAAEALDFATRAVHALERAWPDRPGPRPDEARLRRPVARNALATDAGVIHVVDRPGSKQAELLVGYATVGLGHPDAPALAQLASLLGRDVGGRLFRDLREHQGLAYRINAFQQPAGRFVVTTRSRPERVARLLVGIEAHLRALVDVPLEDCEVEMLRARAEGETALMASDPDRRLEWLRLDVQTRAWPRSLSAYRAERSELDRLALEAAARRHLDAPPIVVLVGDAEDLARRLEQTLPDRPVRVFDADLESLR